MQKSPFIFDRILLVDDNKINNIINKRLFELTHFSREIAIATNGLEGIEYLNRIAANDDEIPQLIFLDVYMPLLDGIGFLSEFPKLAKNVLAKSRVVMLTSSLDADDYNKVNQSPYVLKFVEKPLNNEKILITDLKDIKEQYTAAISIEALTH